MVNMAVSGCQFDSPPRPLEEIEADIRAIEKDIMRMLAEVTGGNGGAHSKRRQLHASADSLPHTPSVAWTKCRDL